MQWADISVQYYLIFISLVTAISLVGIHFYIKNQLHEDHDEGYLWFAGAFGCWILLHIAELNSADDNANTLELIRRVLSLANSACLLVSLSYLQDGFFPWIERLHDNIKSVGIFFAFLALLATTIDSTAKGFVYVEFGLSVLMLGILFLTMARVFWIRISFVSLGWLIVMKNQ